MIQRMIKIGLLNIESIVRASEMPSQVTRLQTSDRSTKRRRFLRSGLVASFGLMSGVAAISLPGCVSDNGSRSPDLMWGRRGLSDGRFIKPRAIAIDADDQLYIVDTTGRIQVFDVDGRLQHGWSTPQIENGKPTGLAIQSTTQTQPRLLVADTHYYRMLAYTLDGQLLEAAQIGGTAGHLPGEFAFVTDAVSDQQGCFYIGEYNASDRIQKFDPEGNFMTQWGGNGSEPGKFVRPQSLVIHNDVLWICDSCNHRIQRFDIRESTPKLMDVWGEPGTGPGQFYYPYDLAIASDGSVVVIEHKNNRLQRFDQTGRWIASWGGPGFEPGELNGPWGVVVDSQDRVHILDSSNHRVQRIDLPA